MSCLDGPGPGLF